MVCLKCGAVCQNGDRVCRCCGSELPQPEEQTVGVENGDRNLSGDATVSGLSGNRSERICGKCGATLSENQLFCQKCGAAVGEKTDSVPFRKGTQPIGRNNGPSKAGDQEPSKVESIKAFEPFFGDWYVESFIGSGSFGSVYKIYKDEQGGRLYSALKHISIPSSGAETTQLRLDGMDDASISVYYSELTKNISAEATLMNKLRGNANIVSFEDSVTLTKPDGVGYDILIRMELLTPLPDRILSQSFSVNDVVKLSIDICNALIECHNYGVIHRDIKPDNIFVSDAGDYKLGDFGIARQLEKTATFMSKKGTYNYMAPEVYVGEKYGANCDIYSLGLVMYRLLNGGRLPFLPPAPQPITPTERESSIVRRMKGEPLTPPAGADESLGAIVLKACAFKPAERYASAKEMKDDLLSYASQGESKSSSALLNTGSAFAGKTILDSTSNVADAYQESDESEATQSLYGTDLKDSNDATRSLYGDEPDKDSRPHKPREANDSQRDYDSGFIASNKKGEPADKKAQEEKRNAPEAEKQDVAYGSKGKSEKEKAPSAAETRTEKDKAREESRIADVHTANDDFESTQSIYNVDGRDAYDATRSMYSSNFGTRERELRITNSSSTEKEQAASSGSLNEKEMQEEPNVQKGSQSIVTEDCGDSVPTFISAEESTKSTDPLASENMSDNTSTREDSVTPGDHMANTELKTEPIDDSSDANESDSLTQSPFASSSTLEDNQPKMNEEADANNFYATASDNMEEVKAAKEKDERATDRCANTDGSFVDASGNERLNSRSEPNKTPKNRLIKGLIISIVVLVSIAAVATLAFLLKDCGKPVPAAPTISEDNAVNETSKPATSEQTRISVTKIALDRSSIELIAGESTKISAIITPDNASDKGVLWATSNASIAKVDKNGLITAKSEGTVIITATSADGGLKAECSLYVKAKTIPVTGVRLEWDKLELTAGGRFSLKAEVSPSNASNTAVSWKSSNTKVAKVDKNGKVEAVSSGTAKITVTTEDGGKKDECTVVVSEAGVHVKSIRISSGKQLKVGEHTYAAVVFEPENASNKSLSWSSSNETVATVDSYGLISANSVGFATITAAAEDGGHSSKIDVIVSEDDREWVPILARDQVKVFGSDVAKFGDNPFYTEVRISKAAIGNKMTVWGWLGTTEADYRIACNIFSSDGQFYVQESNLALFDPESAVIDTATSHGATHAKRFNVNVPINEAYGDRFVVVLNATCPSRSTVTLWEIHVTYY